MPKVSQQPGEPDEIPCEGSGRDPPWRRSISRLASRHRAAILSDIIINENLKLIQINYLAQKVDVLFKFPSRSHCTCNITSGKTVCYYCKFILTY
jgi:hypothetical protein